MEHFQIRTYGKDELVQLYNPHVTQAAACRKLMHRISLQPQLQETLKRYGMTEPLAPSPLYRYASLSRPLANRDVQMFLPQFRNRK